MASYINRLPSVFRTKTEKEFFSATFDQVLSKKDSDILAGFIGRRDPGSFNPLTDFYLPEPSKNRTWWQLEATAYALNADSTKNNIFFYEDLLDRINYYNGNTLNQDRLFESEYYSFGPPIDYDMFINYTNYYWVEQGLTAINITGVLGSDIIGQPSYTTPLTATPPGLTLTTGMTVVLTSDPLYNSPHTIENIGGCIGIRLIPQFSDFTIGSIFEFLPWDGTLQLSNGSVIQNSRWDNNTWDTQTQPTTGDYITIERGAINRNSWSRTNKWFHIDTINATIIATGSSFPSNATRALRPIIQFIADLELFNSGTQFRDEITYGFRDNLFGNPLLLSQFQKQSANVLNSIYSIDITTGDLVAFFNDTTPLEGDYYPWDSLVSISSISGNGSVITVSFNTGDILPVGSYVTIAGVTGIPAYNGLYQITSSTIDQFTFSGSTTGSAIITDATFLASWDGQSWDSGFPSAVNQYIWQATVNNVGIVTFYPYISYSTSVIQGDIVFIDEDAPYDGALAGSTWYFSNGLWFEAFNDKITVNQPPLFQLYDHNGIELNDPVTYPDSLFEGSEIFSYLINASPGAAIDPVLGFPIVYTALGQASDIVFQNNLITNRYTYSNFLPINGYYYYKTSTDPVLYNNWNLYNIINCPDIVPPPPCNTLAVSKQRVIDQYVVGYGSLYQFALSVTPYGYPASGSLTPDIIVSVNGLEVNAAPAVDGYEMLMINNIVYIDLTTYLTNLFTTTQSQPPVVEIQTYTQGLLDPAAKGYYEIPQQLESNPSQLEIGEISGSDLIQQFSSIISNQIDFTGSSFGGSNNYRDSRKNRSVGSYILQNVAPTLKTMLVSQSDDLDFIAGIRFSQNEYTKFKSRYLTIGLQLINQEFNPNQYQTNSIVIAPWVDQILSTINISKEFSNAFAYSYMIASGTPAYSETQIVSGNSLVTLSNYIDLSDPRNVMYIYDATVPALPAMLLVGEDYEITSTNLVIDVQMSLNTSLLDITSILGNGLSVTVNYTGPALPVGSSITILGVTNVVSYNGTYVVESSSIGTLTYVSSTVGLGIVTNATIQPHKTLIFYLYQDPLPTYIPSTPSKLGTYPTYIPKLEIDYSYVNPTNVIIGHDGSKIIAYGDYRDVLLLELERRIYNGIQNKFRNEYYVPLRVESVKPGYFRQTRYSRDEYLNITESYLNKWSAKNQSNYYINNWLNASITCPVNELWKLYNYSNAVNYSVQELNLPGNWKGMFQYYYDTFYPDTQPWEMLGFSQQPAWWVQEYGPPTLNLHGQSVWTSEAAGLNKLWSDLENGIIRQGPTAIYDPITLLPQSQKMWTRPGLSLLIPVDNNGEIIPVPTLFNVAVSGNPYEPYDGFDSDWTYGDGAPVEQAWMSTSGYAYNTQEFMYLMRPGPFGELLWDTLGTTISPSQLIITGIESPVLSNNNWQYVQNDTYTSTDPFFAWFRPKNADQFVHAETVDTVIQIRFGYQCWISDRILFLGSNVADTFGQKIRTLDVNLANKFAGFTNESTISSYIQSVTPGTSTNSLVIPSTNVSVILHKGSPVDTYAYSGVIIRALANGTFVVYGYDLLNASFTTLNRLDNQQINITIGGTPAPFLYFTSGATYNPGDIVRYNGVYYTSLGLQTVQTFASGNWQQLASLPIVGGVSVIYRPISGTTTTTIPYGTIFSNPQEVFDFMIGWGAYLESQGWQFQSVNADTNQVSDWLGSAKQFLFWLNTSWAADASIQLSPLANSASLIVSRGYPDDVETLTNDVYSILDKHGVAILPMNTSVERSGPSITVAPANLSSGGIYFLQITASETEHILIFDNITSFNDTIYDPLLGDRQERIRFNGMRTNGWYGKMEAPGYLIIDNQLVPNYDTIVDSIRYFYDPYTIIDNQSLEALGQHLTGFQNMSYLDNLQVPNNIQYLFYQGAIRQKGSISAIDNLFRNNQIQTNDIITVYEEWALKLGDFGNTVEQVSLEFLLQPQQNTGQVIVARLNFIPPTLGSVSEINILNAENTYTTIPSIIIGKPDAEPPFSWSIFSIFARYSIDSVVQYNDTKGNPVYYSSNIVQGPGPFISANWTVILSTRNATAYAVLNSTGIISRVDIVDPGYGYLSAPYVEIDSGSQPNNLDKLYSIWQGVIVADTTISNIVDVSLDQTDIWLVRPTNPALALQFPTTNNIDYYVPNAGYVNLNDITYSTFNVNSAAVNWGNDIFNPVKDNTIWVAETFTEDWGVYKLVPANTSFNIWADTTGNLYLRTPTSYLLTPQFSNNGDVTNFGNMIVLQVIEATATAIIAPPVTATATATSILGVITAITVVNGGVNYTTNPAVTITDPSGTGAIATAIITGGIITGFDIANGGSNYINPVIQISAPPSTGAIVSLTLNQTGANYNAVPTVTITDVAGSGAVVTATIAGGVVTGFNIVNSGLNYINPVVTISAPTSVAGSSNYTVGFTFDSNETASQNDGNNYYDLITLDGTPITSTDIAEYVNFTDLLLFKNMRFRIADTEPVIQGGAIASVNVLDAGAGYTVVPTVTIVGDGFGASGTAIISGGILIEIVINTEGSNYTTASVQLSLPSPDYLTNGDYVWVDNYNSLWSVFEYNNSVFTLYRQQGPLINTSLFQSASVFNSTGTELIQLPIYDPFKGIFPGPAKQNITYMTLLDPASYNVTPYPSLYNANITFGPAQVGRLWWDLSSTRFIYYEQPIALDGSETETDNLNYRTNNWASIFPGSSVVINEWVQSSVPPAQYAGSGTISDVNTYVQLTALNKFTNILETNYYFWVQNTTDLPNVPGRTMTALDVSLMLQSPKSQGFSFFCPVQQTSTNNSYMFYNVQEILTYQGNDIQIQYRIAERNDQAHAQWMLFREGDPLSLVTDQYWDKMVDSLCGYTQILSASDSVRGGILIAEDLPWDIYGWDIALWNQATNDTNEMYGQVLPVPDPSLSAAERYGIQYRPRQGMFVNQKSALQVFVQAANSLLQYIPIRDNTPSWNANVSTDLYWTYTNWYAVGYENATPTLIYPTLISANNDLIAGKLNTGQIIQVTNGTPDGRYVLYVVQTTSNVSSLTEIGIQNSAILLLNNIYTVTNLYSMPVELRELLNAFRTIVMIDEYLVDQNELYFSMLNYVLSEQKNPDWLFKSSYIYIIEGNIPLTQNQLYIPNQINNVIGYINDVVPYHTQIRDYTTSYTIMDTAPGTASDSVMSKTILQFGPGYNGSFVPLEQNSVDPMVGPNIADVANQIISGVNLPPSFVPSVTDPVTNLYTVPLTFFDASKIGYSKLYPYTFTFDGLNINNPQTFITPANIISVQIGNKILDIGVDYYVEFNNDETLTSNGTYTIYFYNNPGSMPIPLALVWFDGGHLYDALGDTPRSETANGINSNDDFVVNVDTKLPVNDFSHFADPPTDTIPVFGGLPNTYTPYVGWGDIWDVISGPVADALIAAGGSPDIPWDQPQNPGTNPTYPIVLLPNTISYKENLNITDGPNFYRNALIYSGILVYDLLSPIAGPTNNLDVITVFVDPATHPNGTDIFPNPENNASEAVWINGERIEYRLKTLISINTWALSLLRRGTMGTAPDLHVATSIVWVEGGNIIPGNPNYDIWNAEELFELNQLWDEQDWDVSDWDIDTIVVPLGGLWYANTQEADFLKEAQGSAIP